MKWGLTTTLYVCMYVLYVCNLIDLSPLGLFRADETKNRNKPALTIRRQAISMKTTAKFSDQNPIVSFNRRLWLSFLGGGGPVGLCTSTTKELNQGLPETNPASGQSGTWTQDIQISNPTPEPLSHTASAENSMPYPCQIMCDFL